MSATETVDLTKEQERTLRILDFDPALPCELTVNGQRVCGERAAWTFRCKDENCRYAFLACHAHKAEIVAKSVEAQKVGCPKCRRWARRLDDLMDILPLRGSL
jgi:hypothetical protein